jgi:hypothetical protein
MNSNKKYKYASEAGVNLYLGLYQICQQDEFEHLRNSMTDDLKYYNIYFICQRNRLEYRQTTFK